MAVSIPVVRHTRRQFAVVVDGNTVGSVTMTDTARQLLGKGQRATGNLKRDDSWSQ